MNDISGRNVDKTLIEKTDTLRSSRILYNTIIINIRGLREVSIERENSALSRSALLQRDAGEVADMMFNSLADIKDYKLLVLRHVVVAATRLTTYKSLDTSLSKLILDLQRNNDFVQQKKRDIMSGSKRFADEVDGWRVDSLRLLRRRSAVFVSADVAVRDEILLMSKDFYWPNIAKKVEDYIASCGVC